MAAPFSAQAQTVQEPARTPLLPPPAGEVGQPSGSASTQTTGGADFMIDMIRKLGMEYTVATPGNTFKGLHESLVNYGMVTDPKLKHITVNHEETSVAFCHGYAKVAYKPALCMVHSTVGMQHASMAIYNAWADRVPVFCVVGAQLDAAKRVTLYDWVHAVFDGPALVRDFTKWDDTPTSLGHLAESTIRAYKIAMTPPYGPVVLALDQGLQEDPVPGGVPPPIPHLPRIIPPAADENALTEIARILVTAEYPVIMADRAARTPEGLRLMIELAEALQAAVIDVGARFNFPWRHPLNQSALQQQCVRNADVILGLEMSDFFGAARVARKGTRRIAISASDLVIKGNYQDFERFADVDISIAADAEACLPMLVEAVKRNTPASRRSSLTSRGVALAREHELALTASKEAASVGWDTQPITVPRMCAELYEVIRNEDWALVSGTAFQSNWPQKLWRADKHYQYIGDAGAYGLGYLPGAALGAAVAHQAEGRLAVAIGGDGDLLFSPHMLWAAAHNKIPILYIVHNNRAYHQELMWIQQMAGRRDRPISRANIGTVLTEPNIDWALMAKSMGCYGEGPVTNPQDLNGAFRRAVQHVKSGEPALIDIVSQGR